MFVSFPTREKGVCFKGLLFCTVFFTSLLKNLKLDPIQWVEILKQQGYPSDTAGKVSRSSLKMEVAHKTLLPFLVFFFSQKKMHRESTRGYSSGMYSPERSGCIHSGCARLGRWSEAFAAPGWMPLEPHLQVRNHLQLEEKKRPVGKFLLINPGSF